jgi:SAM-dependent methyltransferase
MEQQTAPITAREILERVRQEAERRKAAGTAPRPGASGSSLAGVSLRLPRRDQPEYGPENGRTLHINDLLQYHDRAFVSAAYQAILQRFPDGAGSEHFLDRLRKGDLDRVELIGRLRFSPEGRARGVAVKGLLPRLMVVLPGKTPVLGYLVRWVAAWAKLPCLVKRMEQMETRAVRKENALHRRMDEWAARLEATAADTLSKEAFEPLWEALSGRVDQVTEKQQQTADELHQAGIGDMKRTLLDQQGRVDQVTEKQQQTADELHQAGIGDMKRTLLDQQGRVARLLEQVEDRLPGPMSRQQMQAMVSEKDHLLDAVYAAFEDRFRGSREDIKERQKIYLPWIEQAGAGTATAPVLDLGCGRGEWLELLKETGKTAAGVDINHLFVTECRNRGLTVASRDLLAHLKNQAPDSTGAVSAFHLIEHLPLTTLVRMMDETLRVLKPGGIAIFETPNPENLIVGACSFYTDPTHKNPLPPDTALYLMETRGFCDCEIIRLHPCEKRPGDMVDTMPASLVHLLYGEQDYAVIGRKARV